MVLRWTAAKTPRTPTQPLWPSPHEGHWVFRKGEEEEEEKESVSGVWNGYLPPTASDARHNFSHFTPNHKTLVCIPVVHFRDNHDVAAGTSSMDALIGNRYLLCRGNDPLHPATFTRLTEKNTLRPLKKVVKICSNNQMDGECVLVDRAVEDLCHHQGLHPDFAPAMSIRFIIPTFVLSFFSLAFASTLPLLVPR
jgi:hypothetical protein